MNQNYRLVFNPALGAYVPAPESARGSGKGAARSRRAWRARPLGLACAIAFSGVPGIAAAACSAGNHGELAGCIAAANAGGDNTISITGTILVTGALPPVTASITVNGNGNSFDGGGAHRGFLVASGTLTVNDLTLANMKAQGGHGGNEMEGGGGGMGAGGAIYVRSGASVVINNVELSANGASGGNGGGTIGMGGRLGGGGGGMGGNGGGGNGAIGGGGGGGGAFAGADGAPGYGTDGGNGGGPAGGAGGGFVGLGAGGGTYSGGGGNGLQGRLGSAGSGGWGGGGGGGGNDSTDSYGGAGGWGGGGGGGASGGNAGFGGGGGGSYGSGIAGAAGFGGGQGGLGAPSGNWGGGNWAGGGGGAGLGGAIFIEGGGGLTIEGNLALGGGSVAGGAGGISGPDAATTVTGGAGSAYGSGIFLQGNNAALVFAPGSSTTTQTVSDAIADQAGSGGTGGNAGSVKITKDGAGKLVLGGLNTYSGGTDINAGTVEIGSAANLGSGTVTFAGTPGGTLRNTGTATTLAQRVDVASDSVGTVSTATDTTLTLTGPYALAGNATGSFGSAADAGTIVFSGAGSAATSARIVVGGGTLKDGSGSLSSLVGTIAETQVAAGATLDFGDRATGINNLTGAGTVTAGTSRLQLADADFSGDIAGTGGLRVVAGAGDVILSGANSYSGGTNVASGTLQVGKGGTAGALGSGDVTVSVGATLRFDRSDAVVVGNVLAGSAGAVLEQAGTGSTVLTADSSFNGTVRVSAGKLQFGNGGTTGMLGTTAIYDLGAGAVLAFKRSNDVTFGNAVSGGGRLVQDGTGTLALTGANTYTGGTAFNAGTVQADSAGALGNGGDFAFAGGGLRTTGTMALSQGQSHAAGTSSRIAAATGTTLTLLGGISVGPNTQLHYGSTADTGTIIVSGPSSSTHSSASVWVDGGILRASDAGGLNYLSTLTFNAASTSIAANAELDFNGLAGDIRNLQGAGTLRNDGAATMVQGGAFAGRVRGSMALAKTMTDVLVLSGDNDYSGETVILAGTLQVGAGGTTGSLGTGAVTNHGELVFSRSDTHTVANAIDGSGSLRATGGGTTVLTGTNSYGGTTGIAAGSTLQVGAGGASGSLGTGAVTNDGTLVFNRSDAVTIGHAIDGTGAVTLAAGSTTFTGANGYAGTTTIAAGAALQVGDGGTGGTLGTGNVVNNGTLTFNRSDVRTVANGITGAGALRAAAGTTILTGSNGYTGTTTVGAGATLQVGDGGSSGAIGTGAITNDGTLVFDRSDAMSVGAAIGGSGALTKAGTGTLVLTGASNYTGPTTIDGGTLVVNGSIASATRVNAGARLGGSGTVGSVHVASGGTLAPGNSIGTLSVAGNLAFARGSTYLVEANATGAADRVNTVGAGDIDIQGGTVDVRASGSGYQRNTRYTLLRAAGTRTGAFDSVTTNLVFLTPTLVYENGAVLLDLVSSATSASYESVAVTRNQRAVAGYLSSFANSPGNAQAEALIQQVDNLDAQQAREAFESIAGTAHASASHAASAVGRNFSASLAARTGFSAAGLSSQGPRGTQYASLEASLQREDGVMSDMDVAQAGPARGIETPLASAQQRGMWMQALGSGGRIADDGNGAGSRYGGSGFVLGYDQPVSGAWLAGAAFGYTRTQWDATSGAPASGDIESPLAGLYARYAVDNWRVRLDATFGHHEFSTDRTVTIGNTSGAASSSHSGREWGLAAQVEYALHAGDWQLRPVAGLRHARLHEDSFTETGTTGAPLTVADRTTQNTLLSAGMHFVRLFNGGRGGLELRAVASHLAGDNDAPVTASIAGQAGSFTADGAPLRRDALTLGTTLSGQFSRSVSGYVDVNYEVRGGGQRAYQVAAGVRASF